MTSINSITSKRMGLVMGNHERKDARAQGRQEVRTLLCVPAPWRLCADFPLPSSWAKVVAND